MRLRAAFPKGELNGLSEVHNDAVTHVGKTYLIVGQLRVVETITDYEKSRDAKYAIERLEVVPNDMSATVAELIEAAFADRTGKAVLDLDMPDVVDLRKQYKEKRAKGRPDLAAEPDSSVRVDPAVLAPDELGEENEGAERTGDDPDVWTTFPYDAEPVDEADEAAVESDEVSAEQAGVPFDQWHADQEAASAEHALPADAPADTAVTPTFSG